MTYIKIGNEEYLTVKDAYLNLCVARNAISKKIKFLEKNGYILRVKNKRPEIYISRKGYEKLKEERIQYLDKMINDENNKGLREYYMNLKEAIEKPELWDKFHEKSIIHYIVFWSIAFYKDDKFNDWERGIYEKRKNWRNFK